MFVLCADPADDDCLLLGLLTLLDDGRLCLFGVALALNDRDVADWALEIVVQLEALSSSSENPSIKIQSYKINLVIYNIYKEHEN